MQLAGRTILLTGASGGIGHALTAAFDARGARLVLSGRRPDVLEALAGTVRDAVVEPADLADPAALRELAARHPDVDVLVSNAGIPGSGALTSFSEEQIDRALAVNLRAPIALCRALVPAMVERGSGHVVLVSSLLGRAPMAGSVLYSATKFGLRGFGASLRAELRDTGVGVSTVSPGFVREAGMFADSGASLPPGVGTVSADQVAQAAIEAIEHDRGEVDVAPFALRVGATMAGLAPDLATRVADKLGRDKIAKTMADGQSDKR